MKPFDLVKAKAGAPLITRRGYPARIICEIDNPDTPIVVVITDPQGCDSVVSYSESGKYSENHECVQDLFMAPTKQEGWVNIYRYGNGDSWASKFYATKEEAEEHREPGVVATVKVEWEE